MLDLKMIKLKNFQISLTVITISLLLFFIPFESYSDKINEWWGVPEYQEMSSINDSFISSFNFINANLQYEVRNISGGLICIVQSDNITIYDSNFTFDYLSNHPSRSTFQNNDVLINYVQLKDSWNVGEGDSFLSAIKYIVPHPTTEKPYSLFFATANGCAIQPGDKVTIFWEIVYS